MNNDSCDVLPSRVTQIQAVHHPGDYNCGPHTQLYSLCEDGSTWVQYWSSGGSNVPTDGKYYSTLPYRGNGCAGVQAESQTEELRTPEITSREQRRRQA